MTAETTTRNEDRIRALLEARVRAVRDKDADALAAACAPDVVAFDALPPLQRLGAGAVRERAAAWLGGYDGPVGYEIRDLRVAAGEDAAFASYVYRVTGTLKSGAAVDMWVRATVCLRQSEGEWRIAHEHTSVPFEPDTGRALIDLKP